ncbi:SPOR domain-containing protein [Pseudomonas sp. MIL19]|jgi:DedD protein|uniref:SPOR domain-containing protein n=1 Tax=Pseudomonas sp. MIL19 TaxID=2976979 RepID=UPI00236372E8|nr:SPOR domain-containing protein [Pseudomonas sp. MIL19]MBU0900527.1 SPOR domain-containing protein [Gammaproteobacteria bacterium]MDD2160798.1 SPOR domain-containing protein [Pseudomonas sp. MIL19]
MALLDKGLKQRMVGALVLLALAVIFLPMLLSREDESQRVLVDAPAMPVVPEVPEVELQPVVVPEPQLLPDEPVGAEATQSLEPVDTVVDEPPTAPVVPAQPTAPAKPVVAAPQVAPSKLDANSLPVSWSVQLASLSSGDGAQKLQKTLRTQGYNAYIRNFDGMNRVFVGPLIERAEADRLRDQLNRQHKLNGFVVRFQPEAN